MMRRASPARSLIVYGRGAWRDQPLPRLSTRITRWSRSRAPTRPAGQTRPDAVHPLSSTTAGPAPPTWWWIGCGGRQTTSGATPGRTASTRIPASSVAATAGLRASASTSIARRRRPAASPPPPPGTPAASAAAGRRAAEGGHRQVEAPELAGRRAGQRVDEHHRARHLVPGEVVADVLLDLRLGQPGAGTAHDERLQPLAELLVGHADDGGLERSPGGRRAGPRPRPGTRSRRRTRSCRRRARR